MTGSWVSYGPYERPIRPAHLAYDAQQARLWEVYQTLFNAIMYGYSGELQPGLGKPIDAERYERWRGNILGSFMHQYLLDSPVGADDEKLADLDGLPEHLWVWWYQSALEATKDGKGKGGST